jgi:DNA-binding CsgD family transcriptional regulator
MTERASLDRGAACLCDSRHLTMREIDVLIRTAAGMSASQIAASLHISHRTVEYHVAAMLRRIGAQNSVEAVARCYSAGILIPAEWPPQWSGQFCLAPRSRSLGDIESAASNLSG